MNERLQQTVLVLAMLLCAHALTAKPVDVSVELSTPVLLADQGHTTYLKVGLTGIAHAHMDARAPVNVCIVLDRSSSMGGDKLAKAKEAAIMALRRLDRDDIVSVVAYSSTVQVVYPATKLTNRDALEEAISSLQVSGSTALFAGVSCGATEVRKFLDKRRVNRVILLSDGLANVGPDSPSELGRLGASLIKEGISVTTIGLGLGYNEDLMTQLAMRSDGNHSFAENATDLARIFDDEFGHILSVVAQDVEIKIDCADGIRPIRALGRTADITGQSVTSALNQLYGGQEKYLLLEVELTPTTAKERLVAAVDVQYADIQAGRTERVSRRAKARYATSPKIVQANINGEVAREAVLQIATLNDQRTIALRDQGLVQEAVDNAKGNAAYIDQSIQSLNIKPQGKLKKIQDENYYNTKASNLSKSKWSQRRKTMRDYQYRNQMQQK